MNPCSVLIVMLIKSGTSIRSLTDPVRAGNICTISPRLAGSGGARSTEVHGAGGGTRGIARSDGFAPRKGLPQRNGSDSPTRSHDSACVGPTPCDGHYPIGEYHRTR